MKESKEELIRRSYEVMNSEDMNRCSSGVAVSYNDNNLLEKEMENEKSKLVKERLLNNRYNQTKNDGLTHLVLSAEDRVRVKKYDMKENFLPVYKDRIEEDKDEDNYTSNFDSPTRPKMQRKTVLILPGNVLDLVREYYGNDLMIYSL